ncbi:MAG TPA: PspC domain-containing protein [Pilimelia sp.]|nr:PspC domain-containing protein [Pilimelia sp.]
MVPDKPRLYRSREQRVIAGVAAGIALHVGVSATAVRLAFVVLFLLNGLGALLLYAAYWALVAMPPGDGPPRRRPWVQVAALAVLGVTLVVLEVGAEVPGISPVAGLLVAVVAAGAGIIWHQADRERRRRWRATVPSAPWLGAVVTEPSRRSFLLRFIGGEVLVAIGLIGMVAVYSPVNRFDLSALLSGVVFALVGLAGVALVAAPLVWRTVEQLRAEQAGRIREQERAELAAMVHDQVLHTLALIMRNAGDVKMVQRLARGQERMLRNWLYKPTGSPTERFAAALEQAAAEVEDTYAITVETVVVGDREVDERVGALVAAAREALVNAARHAKVQTVSLYAEVEPEQVSVFVRDRGAGFDLSAVQERRHGVRGSIIGRMDRHGGRAEIRSVPGDGTEVRLTLPTPEGATAAKSG